MELFLFFLKKKKADNRLIWFLFLVFEMSVIPIFFDKLQVEVVNLNVLKASYARALMEEPNLENAVAIVQKKKKIVQPISHTRDKIKEPQ